jgi:hypothetical protein
LIDPDNPKESILADLLWTEKELYEIVRQAINKITNKVTFDPAVLVPLDISRLAKVGQALPPEPVDPRWVVVKAIVACPGGNQPEVFAAIRAHLAGLHIAMTFDNMSSEQIMKIVFEAPRWRPLESNP